MTVFITSNKITNDKNVFAVCEFVNAQNACLILFSAAPIMVLYQEINLSPS